MNKKIFLAALLLVSIAWRAVADEGMWLPMLVKRLNAEDMAKRGCRLTPEEIYDINHSSLKDAIVHIESCTAELISDNGLMLTNHHCAYGAIQQHSTTDHNYLDKGFWAKSFSEDLPIKNLTASILVRMEDVTERVLKSVSDTMSFSGRNKAVNDVIKEIQKEASENGTYKAQVKDMFNGNEFYLYVYITYKDVRLAGAPPQSIGKFGGNTDNWMWPRHTGDFSLMRVYTGKDGKPAAFSKDNIPLKPKHFLPVSLAGYKEGDFAMIMGFPGRTNRYITSAAMELSMKKINPAQIRLMGAKLDAWHKEMIKDEAVRIQYSSKHARIANSWKYYIGQNMGLEKLGIIDIRKKEEDEFTRWAEAQPESNRKYGKIMTDYRSAVDAYYNKAEEAIYLSLGARAIEALKVIEILQPVTDALSEKKSETIIDSLTKTAATKLDAFFKDYHAPTDEMLTAALMEVYLTDLKERVPPPVAAINSVKGDNLSAKCAAWAKRIFSKSMFVNRAEIDKWLQNPSATKFNKDILKVYAAEIDSFAKKTVEPFQKKYTAQTDQLKQRYLEGYLQFHKDKKLYPDANSSERLTYGTVKSYHSRDAVDYSYFTTTSGILEKHNPAETEFDTPQALIDLIRKNDFGPYAENGVMKVAFLTDNDITGGNSGSPVLNAKGELIGLAFDGNWEAMTGDLVFDAAKKRTICADIRYVLFIMDKFAGASNLVNELKIVK